MGLFLAVSVVMLQAHMLLPQLPVQLLQQIQVNLNAANALAGIANAWQQQFQVPVIGVPFRPPPGSYAVLNYVRYQWEWNFALAMAKWQSSFNPKGTASILNLIQLLGHPVFSVREKATQDLMKMGGADAFLVIAAWKNSDPEIRNRAKQILREMAPPPGYAAALLLYQAAMMQQVLSTMTQANRNRVLAMRNNIPAPYPPEFKWILSVIVAAQRLNIPLKSECNP